MNKHCTRYTSAVLCILNAVAFGGGLNLKKLQPSNYLSPNQLAGAHIAVPAVTAGVVYMVNNLKNASSECVTKMDITGGAKPNVENSPYYYVAQAALVGHSLGSAVSLGNEKIGNAICYHSHRTPVMWAACQAANAATSFALNQQFVDSDINAQVVHAMLMVAGYLSLDAVVTAGLTKAGEMTGLIEPEETLK